MPKWRVIRRLAPVAIICTWDTVTWLRPFKTPGSDRSLGVKRSWVTMSLYTCAPRISANTLVV